MPGPLDFFRTGAGDLLAKGRSLLGQDHTAAEEEERLKEEEKKRREEERLAAERLADQQAAAARQEAIRARAQEWLGSAFQGVRDQAGAGAQAAGAVGSAVGQTVGESIGAMGQQLQGTAQRAQTQAEQGLTTARETVDAGLDTAGGLKDEAVNAIKGHYGAVRQAVASNEGAGDRFVADVQRGITHPGTSPTADAILGAVPDQAQQQEEVRLREAALEAERRRRRITIEQQGDLQGMASNLVTGGLTGGDTPENRTYQDYIGRHGGAGAQAQRMLGSGVAHAVGFTKPGDTSEVGAYKPQREERVLDAQGNWTGRMQPVASDTGLAKSYREAHEQFQTVFGEGQRNETPGERAQAAFGLAMTPYNVAQEAASGFVGGATGDPVAAALAGQGAAIIGPGGVDVGDARGMLKSAREGWNAGRVVEGVAGSRPERLRGALGATVSAHGAPALASTAGLVGAAPVGVGAGVFTYQQAKAQGKSDEEAMAAAVEMGGNVLQMGEMTGMGVHGAQAVRATPRVAGRAAELVGTAGLKGLSRLADTYAQAGIDPELGLRTGLRPGEAPPPQAREAPAGRPQPGGGKQAKQAVQAEMAEASKALRAAGIESRTGPAADATPEQTAAYERFVAARQAMADFNAGRAQRQATLPGQDAITVAREAALVERRAAPAGEGLTGSRRRAAEEAAAPPGRGVARTDFAGQPTPLFSQLERALDDPRVQAAAEAGDPGMVLRRLKEAGVTDEELRWTGTDDLATRTEPITPAELQAHVQANKADIREVAFGTDPVKIEVLREAQQAVATAMAERSRAVNLIEQDFMKALVEEGLYDPMPTELSPAMPGGGPDDPFLRPVEAQTPGELRYQQSHWLQRMQQAVAHHLKGAQHDLAGRDFEARSFHYSAAAPYRTGGRPWAGPEPGSRMPGMREWEGQGGQADSLQMQRVRELSKEWFQRQQAATLEGNRQVVLAEVASQEAQTALWPDAVQGQYGGPQSPSAPRWASYSSTNAGRTGEYGQDAGYREFVVFVPPESRIGREMAPTYEHGHWSQPQSIPNPVIHIRATVRSLPDGRRVVYVEEIQTDLHQAARDARKDPNTGRPLLDAAGKKIPVGYRDPSLVIDGPDDPRVVARMPLWQEYDRAWAAWREAQEALRQWRTQPAPPELRGTTDFGQGIAPVSGSALWNDDPASREWMERWRQHYDAAAEGALQLEAQEAGRLVRDAGGDDAAVRQAQLDVLDAQRDARSGAERYDPEINARVDEQLRYEAQEAAVGTAEVGARGGSPARLERFFQLRDAHMAVNRAYTDGAMALSRSQHALQLGNLQGGPREPGTLEADLFIQTGRQAAAMERRDAAYAAFREFEENWNDFHSQPDGSRSALSIRRDPDYQRLNAAMMTARDDFDQASGLLQTLRGQMPTQANQPPQAPFQQTWVQVALKRMLLVAADEGLDGVALTPGKIAAERVGAAQQITEAAYFPELRGGLLEIVDLQGGRHEFAYDEAQLRTAVGDDLAQALLDKAEEDRPRWEAEREQAENDRNDRQMEQAQDDFDNNWESRLYQEEGESDEAFDLRQQEERDEAWENYNENQDYDYDPDYDSGGDIVGRLGPDEIAEGSAHGNVNLIKWYDTDVRNAATRLARRLGAEPFLSEVVAPESKWATHTETLEIDPDTLDETIVHAPEATESDVLVIPLDEAQRARLREEGLPLFMRGARPADLEGRQVDQTGSSPQDRGPAGAGSGAPGALALRARVPGGLPRADEAAGAVLGAGAGQEEERRRIEAERLAGRDVGLGEEAWRRGSGALLGGIGGLGLARARGRRGPAGLIDLDNLPTNLRGPGSRAADRLEPVGRRGLEGPVVNEATLAERRLGTPRREAEVLTTDEFGQPYGPDQEHFLAAGGRPANGTVMAQLYDAFEAGKARAEAAGRAFAPEDVDLTGISVPKDSALTSVRDLVDSVNASPEARRWYSDMGAIVRAAFPADADPRLLEEAKHVFANFGQQSTPWDNVRLTLASFVLRAKLQADPALWNWVLTTPLPSGTTAKSGGGKDISNDPMGNPRALIYNILFGAKDHPLDPVKNPVPGGADIQPMGTGGLVSVTGMLHGLLDIWRTGEREIGDAPKLSTYEGNAREGVENRPGMVSTADRHEFARMGLGQAFVGADPKATEEGRAKVRTHPLAPQYVWGMNAMIAKHFFPGEQAREVQAPGWVTWRKRPDSGVTKRQQQQGDPKWIAAHPAVKALQQAVKDAVADPSSAGLRGYDLASNPLGGVVSRGARKAATGELLDPTRRSSVTEKPQGLRPSLVATRESQAAGQAAITARSPSTGTDNLSPAEAETLAPGVKHGQRVQDGVVPLRNQQIIHEVERTDWTDTNGDQRVSLRITLQNGGPTQVSAAVGALGDGARVWRPDLDPNQVRDRVAIDATRGQPVWTRAEVDRVFGIRSSDPSLPPPQHSPDGRTLVWENVDEATNARIEAAAIAAGYAEHDVYIPAGRIERPPVPGATGATHAPGVRPAAGAGVAGQPGPERAVAGPAPEAPGGEGRWPGAEGRDGAEPAAGPDIAYQRYDPARFPNDDARQRARQELLSDARESLREEGRQRFLAAVADRIRDEDEGDGPGGPGGYAQDFGDALAQTLLMNHGQPLSATYTFDELAKSFGIDRAVVMGLVQDITRMYRQEAGVTNPEPLQVAGEDVFRGEVKRLWDQALANGTDAGTRGLIQDYATDLLHLGVFDARRGLAQRLYEAQGKGSDITTEDGQFLSEKLDDLYMERLQEAGYTDEEISNLRDTGDLTGFGRYDDLDPVEGYVDPTGGEPVRDTAGSGMQATGMGEPARGVLDDLADALGVDPANLGPAPVLGGRISAPEAERLSDDVAGIFYGKISNRYSLGELSLARDLAERMILVRSDDLDEALGKFVFPDLLRDLGQKYGVDMDARDRIVASVASEYRQALQAQRKFDFDRAGTEARLRDPVPFQRDETPRKPDEALPPFSEAERAEQAAYEAAEQARLREAQDFDEEEVVATGVGRAQADFSKKEVVSNLKSSLYKEDQSYTIVKELVQNTIDGLDSAGVLRDGTGKLRVDLYPEEKVITIADNGNGMSPVVVRKKFVIIGASHKPNQESPRGNFGFAKVAILGGTEDFKMVTQWRSKTGEIHRTVMEGNAEDWLGQGFRIASEVVTDPAHQWTGTKMYLKLVPEAKFNTYSAAGYLSEFAETNTLPIAFQIEQHGPRWTGGPSESRDLTLAYDRQNSRVLTKDDGTPIRLGDPADRPTILTTLTLPGQAGTADLYLTPSVQATTSLPVSVLSNGLVQAKFTVDVRGQEGEALVLPSRVVVDIKNGVSGNHPDYAWTASREDIQTPVKEMIAEYVQRELADAVRRSESRQLIEAIEQAPYIGDPVHRLQWVNASGFDDTLGTVQAGMDAGPDISMERATENHSRLAQALWSQFTRLQEMFARTDPEARDAYAGSVFSGFGASRDWLGVNVGTASFAPGEPFRVYLNPHLLYDKAQTDAGNALAAQGSGTGRRPTDAEINDTEANELAHLFVSTLNHELNHQRSRPHGNVFEQYLTGNIFRTLREQIPLLDEMTALLKENDFELLKQIRAEQTALSRASTSRPADLFARIGTQKRRGARGAERGDALRRPGGTGGRGPGQGRGPDAGLADPAAVAGRERGGHPGDLERDAGIGDGPPGDLRAGAGDDAGRPTLRPGGPGRAGNEPLSPRGNTRDGAAERRASAAWRAERAAALAAGPGAAGAARPGSGSGAAPSWLGRPGSGSRVGSAAPATGLVGANPPVIPAGSGAGSGLTPAAAGAGSGSGGRGAIPPGRPAPGVAGGQPGAQGPQAPQSLSRARRIASSGTNLAKLGLLLGPRGLLRQALGQAVTLPGQVIDRAGAATLAVPERLVRSAMGRDTSTLPKFGEAGAMLGAYRRNAFPALGKATDILRGRAVSSQAQALQGAKGAPPKPGLIDAGYRVVGFFDEIARVLAIEGERAAQGYRGVTGKAADAKAEEAGAYRTLTQDLDKAAQKLDDLRDNPAGQFVLPFWKVPYNGLKYDLERSPLGLIKTLAQETTGLGGRAKDATERYERLTRGLLGSGISFALLMGVANDRISGPEPENQTEKDAWRVQGKTPFSVRVGDRWIPTDMVPGLHQSIVQAATLNDHITRHEATGKPWDADAYYRAANRLITQVAYYTADRPFFENLFSLMQTMRGTGANEGLLDWAGETATGFVAPAVVRDVERYGSDVNRVSKDAGERWMAQVPGLSGRLPAARDPLNNVVRRAGSPTERLLNPLLGRPATSGLRRYPGSSSAERDTQISEAIQRVQDEARLDKAGLPVPRGERPTGLERTLAGSYGGAAGENPSWVDRRALARAQEAREKARPSAAALLVGRR